MSNPCSKNNSSLIKEEKCNGLEDKVSYTDIENGFCLGKNCIDEQNIQRLRLTHLDPYEGSTPQKGTPPVAGDFRDPFTKRLVKNREMVQAGIRDPTEKNYDGDHDYNIKKYVENHRRISAVNKIRRKFKQSRKPRILRTPRMKTPDSFYKNLLSNISPISGEPLYNNKRLHSDASYMRMLQNESPAKSPLYVPTPATSKIRRLVQQRKAKGIAIGGTRRFK